MKPTMTLSMMVAILVGCGGSSPKPAEPVPSPTATEEKVGWDSTSESGDDAARRARLAKAGKLNEGSDDRARERAHNDEFHKSEALPISSAAPKQRRSDEWDQEATEVVLKRAARQVRDNCGAAKDDTGRATGPWGPTKVTVVLGHTGRSKEARVSGAFEDKVTGKCIINSFSNLTFPPWSGADKTVEWDVEVVKGK